MGTAKHIGRIGALAVALGVGIATAVPAPTASASDVAPPAKTTALIVCGTTCPTFDAASVEIIMNQFIKPTRPPTDPGETITPVAVTTPNEAWPLTGILRLVELAIGDPRLGGPGGPAWPDEPWWKLSGLFDLTGDQSIATGVADLEAAMAANPGDHVVIYGYSQGSVVVNKEREKLAAQYAGTTAPDIDFVLAGDVGVPNGGFGARFPGLHIPVLDWTYDGAHQTDTPFDTTVITRQYDGFADFPLYPLNLIALSNAALGLFYVHTWPFDVSLADNTAAPVVSKDPTGKTTYYFFENPDLPLFGPLRTLGVPEPVIDVFEPFFREVVELGYNRSIPAWQPTPARLIPPLDPVKVTTDLVNAIGEGANNAAALFGAPAPLSIPAAPATADQDAVVEQVLSGPDTAAKRVGRDVGNQVVQELAATRDHLDDTIGAVKSAIGNGRSAGSDDDNPTAGPTRKTPLRDAVAKAGADVKKVVTQMSDNVKKALGGDRDKANTGPEAGPISAP